jgi:hypothetical protein
MRQDVAYKQPLGIGVNGRSIWRIRPRSSIINASDLEQIDEPRA